MERRTLKRKSVDVDVYVTLPGCPAMRCVASDISRAGVFIKTNPLYLPRDRRINLMFALNLSSSSVVRLRRVPAVVVRSGSDGVGMIFCGRNSVEI